ncbi:MAG: extracellular solute-binding protein, partial [Tepidisphaeraceae bacterium]
MLRRPTPLSLTLWVSLTALLALAGPADAKDDGAPGDGQKKREKIVLRAFGVPDINAVDPAAMAELRIMGAFRKKFPRIEPTSPTGIQLPGGRNMDMVPLMQIAGGIAPDVMYVNFRQSHSYITMKLLHPLEEFIEGDAGLPSADRGALDTDKYIDALRKAPRYDAMLLEQRVPRQCWEVTRRDCPLGADCRYRRKRGFEPMERHRHVFAFPIAPLAMGMQYDRQLMAEYEDQGVEMRAPKDWDELMRWATIITDPEKKHYGLMVSMTRNPSWYLLSFLYSTGGRIVEEQPDGNWKCVIDTEAAVEAVYFYCRLRWERFKKSDGREIEGVVAVGDEGNTLNKHAMQFTYLDNRFMSVAVDKSKGFGPIPLGPTGIRGGEFNAQMLGIFSGLGEKPERLRAAWEYIQYFDGPEARRLRVEGLVDGGVGEFVRPALLKQFNDNGRYESLIQQSDKALDEIYRTAFESGVPEPYGKNCNSVYDQVDKPLGECLQNDTVKQAIWTNNPQMGKDKIREILKRGAATINEKMLGNLPPAKVRQRQWISWTVIAVVLLLFVWVLKRTYIAFRPPDNIGKSAWQFGRYRFAYLLLLPALLSIGLWAYWPLAKGTAVAFQDYSVLGDSDWVGAKNFAEVLFD